MMLRGISQTIMALAFLVSIAGCGAAMVRSEPSGPNAQAVADNIECRIDTDCDDGLFCNGRERCAQGECLRGSSPCGDDKCDETPAAASCGIPDTIYNPVGTWDIFVAVGERGRWLGSWTFYSSGLVVESGGHNLFYRFDPPDLVYVPSTICSNAVLRFTTPDRMEALERCNTILRWANGPLWWAARR